MTHYDLVVIGTGSGNSIVDERFADRSVAILEHGTFGGTCLNVGCIPTKMFVYPADLARGTQQAARLGVDAHVDAVHWPRIRDRIFGRIDPIAAAGEDYRRGQSNVDVYTGTARFTGERTLQSGGHTITGDQVVLAAGSRAVPPAIPGLDTVPHHTSDTIMRLPTLPRHLTIVGGGFVAAEFAHVFSAFGTQVTQVQRGPRLLRIEDEEISARFTRIAQRQWDVRLQTTVTRVEPAGDGVLVHLSDGSTVESDVLLTATGRVPNSDVLDVAAAGIATDDHGVVVVDDFQHTTAEGVWALGDISGDWQLKHVANHEARVVQHNLLQPDDLVRSDHRFVPAAVFSSPQVASVGLSSQVARAQGLEVVEVVQEYADVAYGWAMEGPADCAVKLVADAGTGELLGAHLVGPEASVLIQPLIQAMSLGTPTAALARGQYWIHPALTEVVENALLKLGETYRSRSS